MLELSLLNPKMPLPGNGRGVVGLLQGVPEMGQGDEGM